MGPLFSNSLWASCKGRQAAEPKEQGPRSPEPAPRFPACTAAAGRSALSAPAFPPQRLTPLCARASCRTGVPHEGEEEEEARGFRAGPTSISV